MGLREQSIVCCFPEFFFQFSAGRVLVGLRNKFINNFVSRLGPVLLVLIIIIIIIIIRMFCYRERLFVIKKFASYL